jgi:hypothetical protein
MPNYSQIPRIIHGFSHFNLRFQKKILTCQTCGKINFNNVGEEEGVNFTNHVNSSESIPWSKTYPAIYAKDTK